MDWQALALSLRLATVTTAILLAVGIPLASLLVLGRGRWLAAVEALSVLPLVLPPTVLGFFLLVLLGPRTAFGRVVLEASSAWPLKGNTPMSGAPWESILNVTFSPSQRSERCASAVLR